MKIAFIVPAANLANAAIQMENQYFLVSDIIPLCKKVTMADATIGGVASTIIYFDIDKLIQSAGLFAGGVFTVSSDWQRLDNSNVEVYKNFNKGVTVAKFVRGTTYLIPCSQFAALNMIPDFQNLLRANTGLAFAVTSFLYQCAEDTEILNDTDVANCITVEYNSAIAHAAAELKAPRKMAELAAIDLSTGLAPNIVKQKYPALMAEPVNQQLIRK